MSDLPKKGNLVLDHRYWLGSFRDFSGNGNSGVPTGTHFEKRPDKHLRVTGTDVVTVADSPELQLTNGCTFIWYGDIDTTETNARIISKRDGGGTDFDMYYTNDYGGVGFYDGSVTHQSSFTLTAKSVAVVVPSHSASTIKLYANGVYEADFSGTIDMSANDASLYLGNFYNGASPANHPIKGVLIYNTDLTDEEIAQAHEWIMSTKSVSLPKKEFKYPSLVPEGKQTSYGSQLLTDGDMEAVGTSAWHPLVAGVITKETTNPHSGTQVLRIARDTSNNPNYRNTFSAILGKKYRITGWARSDGNAIPKIVDFNGVDVWAGTTSTDWQYFNFIYNSNGYFRLRDFTSTGNEYVEFDDVTVTEVKETIFSADMKIVHGKVIDKTGNGNDGTITNCSQTKSIGGMNALTFNGVDTKVDTSAFNSGLTDNFTFTALVKTNSTSYSHILAKYASPYPYCWGIVGANHFIKINDNAISFSDGSIEVGQWQFLSVTYDKVAGEVKAYTNGNLVDTQSYSTSVSDGSMPLFIGHRINSFYWDGEIANVQIFNTTKTADEIKAMYNEYAKLPVFIDDLSDANESVAEEGGAVGDYLSNTKWKFGSATAKYKISRDSTTGRIGGSQLLADGDMEAVGTSAWSILNVTLTKQSGARTGGSGSLYLRSATDLDASRYAYQNILTNGKKYRITGWARGDGTASPRIYVSSAYIWSGTTSTDWQYFDIIIAATDTYVRLYTTSLTAGTYTDWDDITIYEIDGDEKVIECTTDGILYQEMQQAYGTWEFNIYKTGSSTSTISFIASGIVANGNFDNGYYFRLSASEELYLRERVGGANSTKFITGTGYINDNTWYKIRITRRYDGQFTAYIKGGDFVNWTLIDVSGGSGSNPVTDNTTKESKYLLIDLDDGDKITNFKFYEGVMTP